MEGRRTSLFENGMIWFGAGISIAEILTGTYLAPLGFGAGMAAILIGHLIGCALMFLAGIIGARQRRSSMEAARMSFGKKGAMLFSILNVMQLAGWTAIMIYDGALAAGSCFHGGMWIWCIVIGALIIAWIALGVSNLGKVNALAMTLLLILTIILSKVIFIDHAGLTQAAGAMSFGAAVELSVAMPLSWLPVIADYTREAERPIAASAVSVIVYGAASCWMYIIGLGAALLTQESDIAAIMVQAGLGVAGLLIIVFSTVTTTFLDAYSAGVSAVSIFPSLKEKTVGIAVTLISILASILFPMDDITDFLYLIGSVFAPMIAIQIADVLIMRHDRSESAFCFTNLLIWLAGFLLYRLLMQADLPLGSTLPDMVIVMLITLAVQQIQTHIQKKEAR